MRNTPCYGTNLTILGERVSDEWVDHIHLVPPFCRSFPTEPALPTVEKV